MDVLEDPLLLTKDMLFFFQTQFHMVKSEWIMIE